MAACQSLLISSRHILKLRFIHNVCGPDGTFSSPQVTNAPDVEFMIVSHLSASYRLEPGQMFEGRYRILRELGSGGFGMVYLAHQEAMGRHVALKVLTPGPGAEEMSAKARFLREVQIISKLRHPNTVTIHDFGETLDGVVYMVLEYIEGETLKTLLRREGAQDPIRALMLTSQVARSVAEAHRYGIVHRDLKPANIMIMNFESEKDVVKVLDFGVARLLDTADADLTSAGTPDGERALIGTPRYMSPEQVRGQSLGPASDIYSMGLMLYEMLIGEPAVQGDTTMSLIMQQISPEPLQLPMLRNLHLELQRVVHKATEKQIDHRYASATEFADDLEQVAMYLGTSGQRISAALPMPALIRHATGSFSQSGVFAQNFSSDAQETIPHMAAFVPPKNKEPSADRPVQERSAARTPVIHNTPSPNAHDRSTHDRSAHDSFLGLAGVDLPPPPMDTDNPFATPAAETSQDSSTSQQSALNVVEEESLTGFSTQTALLIALALLACVSTYFAFLFMGVLVNFFLDDAPKFIATVGITLAIPVLTLLSEHSQKERFEVIIKPTDRIRRVTLITSLFSGLVVILISLLMPASVINEFRGNPNWFLRSSNAVTSNPGPIATLNRNISFALADVVDSTTRAFGLYKPEPAKKVAPVPAFKASPPPATRPGKQEANSEANNAPDSAAAASPAPQASDSARPATASDKTDAAPPPKRSTAPPPTRPRKDSDSDYVRW